MIDTIHRQQFQGLVYVFRWSFFTGMCNTLLAELCGLGKNILKQLGWVSQFGGIKAHAGNAIKVWLRRLQSVDCTLFIKVA